MSDGSVVRNLSDWGPLNMIRIQAVVLLLLGIATGGSLVCAQEAQRGELITIDGAQGPIKAYLARPEGDGPFPAVLVIHEWWGLSDWIKQNTDHLAAQGYVALAVDLYKGQIAADPAIAHELMRALDQAEVLGDLKGGVKFLEAQKYVKPAAPFAVIGWCMGGGYAREIAQASESIGPTVICYGSVTTDKEQIALLKNNPVLGIFGGTDRGIPVVRVKQFGAMLNGQGTKADIQVYEQAGHGFMRPDSPQHDAEAAKKAWAAIDAFFKANLSR